MHCFLQLLHPEQLHHPDTDTNYGDVNLDGKVDLVDAITINKYLAGQITLSEQATKNADVNADGSLGDGDSTMLYVCFFMILTRFL